MCEYSSEGGSSYNELFRPISPEQLSRIESVHRGFFYQHLYAVGCLFLMRESNAKYVIVERDEDLEIAFPDEYLYIQVKTRQNGLQPNDIADTITRFDTLRREHSEGKRHLKPTFFIVSNSTPSPKLLQLLSDNSWPKDIVIVWPGLDIEMDKLPKPWPNIESGIEWCAKIAETIPFATLRPETLLLKLAAHVQWAATGHQCHRYKSDELEGLFELIIIQLQTFPEPPYNYRSHIDEPDLISEKKNRLLIGFSGSGKTSWASQMAQYSEKTVTYFDIGDLPGQAIASSLARELTARFLSSSDARQSAGVLAANSGLESLRALNQYIANNSISITVVLDNIHRIDFISLRSVLEAASYINFVMLGQPFPEQAIVATHLGVEIESLQGWSEDTIAAEFSSLQNQVELNSAIRIKELTAGLPLFVQNAAYLTKNIYEGRTDNFIAAITDQAHLETTAQEVILKQVFEQLSSDSKILVAFVSLVDVPLALNEVEELCAELLAKPQRLGSVIRELVGYGILQVFQNKQLKLHQAFYILAHDYLNLFDLSLIEKAKKKLCDLLIQSLLECPDLGRSSLWVRLLPQTGQTNVLIDLATMEIFHERGNPEELKAALESASNSIELSISDRFWALDALVFWNYQDGNFKDIPDQIQRMVKLANEGNLGPKEKFAVCMKQMLQAAKQGNNEKVEEEFKAGLKLTKDESLLRIHRYNYAQSLFILGEFSKAERFLIPLIKEYYEYLGLSPEKVFRKNLPEIIPLLKRIKDWEDDAKHLADCLNLYAMARYELGKFSGVARLHALKFYEASSSYRSAVKAAQDAADELLFWQADSLAARQIIEEHALQILGHIPLPDLSIHVRSQYAVILAWCGEIEAARTEMGKISAYDVNEIQQLELNNQNLLIDKIAAGHCFLQKKIPPPDLDIFDSRILAQMTMPIQKESTKERIKKSKIKQQKKQRRKNRR